MQYYCLNNDISKKKKTLSQNLKKNGHTLSCNKEYIFFPFILLFPKNFNIFPREKTIFIITYGVQRFSLMVEELASVIN